VGIATIARLDQADALVTDARLDRDALTVLREAIPEVVIAGADGLADGTTVGRVVYVS